MRDKGDDLSRVLQSYGEQENLNKSLRSAVCETADTIAAVQDYRYGMKFDMNVFLMIIGRCFMPGVW